MGGSCLCVLQAEALTVFGPEYLLKDFSLVNSLGRWR